MLRTILLVDDERDSLEPMRVLLEDDYRVLTAENGEAALSIMEKEPVEIIVSDQRMPGMTGVELLARVREMKPEIVRLVLSAYTDFDATIKAINEGQVYRYVIKPWDVNDMKVTIRQALDWKDLRSAHGQLAADLAMTNRELIKRTKELEKAQQTLLRHEKLAAVGRFAAEMVHEMNNHLQIILCLNESLAGIQGVDREQLSILESMAKTLTEITANIRDFARGAALPFAAVVVNPLESAQEVIRALQRHPDFRGKSLQIDAKEVTPWRLDPRQIKHLLLNLLKNAARASQKGQDVTLQLSVQRGYLVYRVIDHGTGVPKELCDRIFEPFFTQDPDGTGLGLSICSQVVQAHNGIISIEETTGGGSTFVVRIPR